MKKKIYLIQESMKTMTVTNSSVTCTFRLPERFAVVKVAAHEGVRGRHPRRSGVCVHVGQRDEGRRGVPGGPPLSVHLIAHHGQTYTREFAASKEYYEAVLVTSVIGLLIDVA